MIYQALVIQIIMVLFYKNKTNNVWGRDIKPEYPKNPHIVLKNDFKKNKNFLSIELIKKINNLRFKFI
jgi:hypothetical protein